MSRGKEAIVLPLAILFVANPSHYAYIGGHYFRNEVTVAVGM